MSTQGKIKTLYSDKEKTEALFPRTKISAVSDSDGTGLDVILDNINSDLELKATETFVTNKIAEAQLDGSGDIDLSGYVTKDDLNDLATKESLNNYATKDDLNAIDFPVDSVNGKTGAVTLSAGDIGALPTTGGTLTGDLVVGSENSGLRLRADNEGGNIFIYPPSVFKINDVEYKRVVDSWQMDAHDGKNLRIFGYKNADNPNGQGDVFSLTIGDDGAISVANAAKTRDNLGITPANIGAIPKTGGDVSGDMWFSDSSAGLSWSTADGTIIHLRPWSPGNVFQITLRNPTKGIAEYGAFNIGTDGTVEFSKVPTNCAPAGFGLGDIAKRFTISTMDELNAYTSNGWYAFNLPSVVQVAGVYLDYAFMRIDNFHRTTLRQTIYVLDSNNSVLVRTLQNGVWGEWKVENPPMLPGVEYRTTESYNNYPVYCKFVGHENASTYGEYNAIKTYSIPHGISGFRAIVRVEAKQDIIHPMPTFTSAGGVASVRDVTASNILLQVENATFETRQWNFVLYYTK